MGFGSIKHRILLEPAVILLCFPLWPQDGHFLHFQKGKKKGNLGKALLVTAFSFFNQTMKFPKFSPAHFHLCS